MNIFTTLVLLPLLQVVTAQSVTCNLEPKYAAPVMADGWESRLVVNGLKRPRSILFDTEGALLVVEQRTGIRHLKLADGNGTCLSMQEETTLVQDSELNHGLTLSNDGRTLYASTADVVYAWDYDPASPSLGGKRRIVVNGMDSGGHTSRTLMMSQRQPGILVVSRGSDGNVDIETADVTSGRSQLKAFDLNTRTAESGPLDYASQGILLGWGLRNSVGVAEEPTEGGIYSVENSVDEIERAGVDIHQDNPGEEMNYHGFLNGSKENQGGNHGYPYCFALWDTAVPNNDSLSVGSQFSMDQTTTSNDTFCRDDRIAPRLTFQAHMAPLDMKFLPNGTQAFISFHGSWDRSAPVGYKVSSIDFASGSPVAAADSRTAATDIMSNPDLSACPENCFRPVGLAMDGQGRMFMSSDATNEIWVLAKGSSGSSTGGGGSPAGTGTGTSPSPTASKSTAMRWDSRAGPLYALFWAIWTLF
ncbi:soluble quino protein glucose/sorbosone dehydrogenase [Rhexocercosporidium sp. MPI-PUGE-AT-0058]|nr:soluble quino protein glucose/sorbosone dehydrogenase [Rhexocercosporidium sp. MPI-PUGE-AT-0058]